MDVFLQVNRPMFTIRSIILQKKNMRLRFIRSLNGFLRIGIGMWKESLDLEDDFVRAILGRW